MWPNREERYSLTARTSHGLVWGHGLVPQNPHVFSGGPEIYIKTCSCPSELSPAPCRAPPSLQSLRLDTWVPFEMPPTTELSHGHPIQSRSSKDLKMSTSSFSQTTIPAKGYTVSHVDYCNNRLPGLSASSNLHIEVRGIFLRCKTGHVIPLPKVLQGHIVLKSCL